MARAPQSEPQQERQAGEQKPEEQQPGERQPEERQAGEQQREEQQPVQQQPEERQPGEQQPEEQQPAEQQPGEQQPEEEPHAAQRYVIQNFIRQQHIMQREAQQRQAMQQQGVQRPANGAEGQLVQLEDPNAPAIPVLAPAPQARMPTSNIRLTKNGTRVGRPPGYHRRYQNWMGMKLRLKEQIDFMHQHINAMQWRNRYDYYERTGEREIPVDWKTSEDLALWQRVNRFVMHYNQVFPGEEEALRRQFAELARHSTHSDVTFMRPQPPPLLVIG